MTPQPISELVETLERDCRLLMANGHGDITGGLESILRLCQAWREAQQGCDEVVEKYAHTRARADALQQELDDLKRG